MNQIKMLLFLFLLLAICELRVHTQALGMEEVIKTAIENNPEVTSAKLNIQKEEAVKLKSFNLPRPELFIEYEGIKGSVKNFESRKIGILQELEFPTNYFMRQDVQSTQVEIAKQELNRLILNIKFETANAYLKLQLCYKLLEIAKANLKIYNDFLFVAGKKYDAGSTSNLEVLGAKVSKIKFENEVKNLESEIIVTKSELMKLMNAGNYAIEPADELKFEERNLSKDMIILTAVENNPRTKINKLQKEKFSNKISLTKSELLPNLSLKYYNQKIGDDGGFWGFEIGIGLPLWFWWEPAGNIQEADYELKIASNDGANLRKSIESEVNQAFEEYENSMRQGVFFRDEAMQEADEILRQARISYEEGAIGYVEYLQALQIVYDTRTQYFNSIWNYNKSIIKLENIAAGDIK